jgi:hypothetical protein
MSGSKQPLYCGFKGKYTNPHIFKSFFPVFPCCLKPRYLLYSMGII